MKGFIELRGIVMFLVVLFGLVIAVIIVNEILKAGAVS